MSENRNFQDAGSMNYGMGPQSVASLARDGTQSTERCFRREHQDAAAGTGALDASHGATGDNNGDLGSFRFQQEQNLATQTTAGASYDLNWPDLNWSDWHDTGDTLHRWTQIVGKVRMALSPMMNHWWQVVLYVNSRGLTTSAIPYGGQSFDVTFDFIDHALVIETSSGAREQFALKAMSVAEFYSAFLAALRRLGIDVRIWTMPCEIPDAVPFQDDHSHAAYDADYARRFWQVLLQSHRVLTAFRSRFVGKSSPVHFFWGSFDLAVTRFSGRRAPPYPGAAPNVANWVMREAYSQEVSSCGFWPGNGGYGRAAFYSYAYPEPPNFDKARIQTSGAFYDPQLKEFILPYDVVRQAPDPDGTLMGFLRETYDAAADAAGWDRADLERAPLTAPTA
jgi:hypothetical protein